MAQTKTNKTVIITTSDAAKATDVEKQYGNGTITKVRYPTWIGTAKLTGIELAEPKQVAATDKAPAYLHAKMLGVDVHLREGLTARDAAEKGCRVEVKLRQVSNPSRGNYVNGYFYLLCFPLADGESAEHEVAVVNPAEGKMILIGMKEAKTVFVPEANKASIPGHIVVR